MPLKDRYPTNGSSRKGLPRKVAQAAAKKSCRNRDLPNWRDRVGDLLKEKEILVKDLREVNALYVAARRKGVQTRRFKLSNAQLAVVALGPYDRKIEFIAAGNCLLYAPRRIDLAIESGGKGGNLSRSFHDQQELKP